jgi:hypothetical protein
MGGMIRRDNMAAKKDEYEFLSIEITNYKAYVNASINYEVMDKRHYYDDAKVYDFGSHLEIEGICNYPEEREGDEHHITIYSTERSFRDFELTLSDCQVRNEDSTLKYRRVRGKDVPVYNIPKGLGTLEKVRGEPLWTGCLWVKQETVTQVLSLLPVVKPLYMYIHERKIDRHRWIVNFAVQTSDPAEE